MKVKPQKNKDKAAENGKLVCSICKLNIDTNKPFAEFIHYLKKSDILSVAFYHVSCFRNRINGGIQLQELQKQAKYILDIAQKKIE